MGIAAPCWPEQVQNVSVITDVLLDCAALIAGKDSKPSAFWGQEGVNSAKPQTCPGVTSHCTFCFHLNFTYGKVILERARSFWADPSQVHFLVSKEKKKVKPLPCGHTHNQRVLFLPSAHFISSACRDLMLLFCIYF